MSARAYLLAVAAGMLGAAVIVIPALAATEAPPMAPGCARGIADRPVGP